MLNGLRGVVIQMRANPATAKSLSSTGTNLLPMIAAAKQEVARLDQAELGQLRAGLSHDPNWQQAPSSLSAAVAAFASASTSGTGTFTDNCASAGNPYDEQIAVLVANEVQSGLVAAALSRVPAHRRLVHRRGAYGSQDRFRGRLGCRERRLSRPCPNTRGGRRL